MNVEKNHEVKETMDGYKTTSVLRFQSTSLNKKIFCTSKIVFTRIRNFSLNDAGPYECVSTNSLGRADHVIRIYGKYMPS